MREILIVDDVPENLQMLQLILKQPNHRVRAATSASIALKLIHDRAPHLVITDIKMPEMSGIELCTMLKQNEQFADIPIIFVSALSETDNIVEAFEAGGVDYITKPFKPAEVMARVKTHLSLLEMKQLELSQAISARMRQMIIGIAHEVNTPLGTSITATSYLAELVNESEQHFLQKTLSAEELGDFYKSHRESLYLVQRGLSRVKYCVEALRSISLADSQAVLTLVNLNTLLLEVEHKIRQLNQVAPYKLALSLPNEALWLDEEKLSMTLYHLIQNSLVHANVEALHISINAYISNDNLYVNYSDNGVGLQDLDVAEMLTPFITTKRGNAGHMGLSAPICANLIKSGMQGSLTISSSNHGLTWSFVLPYTVNS
ncbi:hypothetical protein PALB_31210 [Pseudoalteromonas luteoviolacea B = ATCC 29581]|nr:hypothetical protein PALB_31210 [Pseudoalteromonas luteoviolacea B = ATCC 29581]